MIAGIFDDLTLSYIFTALIFFAVFIVLSALWRSLLNFAKTNSRFKGGSFFSTIALPGYMLVFAVTFFSCCRYLDLSQTNSQIYTFARMLLNAAIVVVVGEILFFAGLRSYTGRKPGEEFPSIFRQLLKGLVYVILFLSFLSNSYNLDITPLLTTSAVFTMVLGLALQDVLGNLFSGLSVHISPPFRIGDWVTINSFSGKVVESNWRATSLQLASGAVVILPNNQIARNEITNFSDGTGAMFKEFCLGLPYGVSPERVRRVLTGACRQVREIFSRPQPLVILEKFDEYSINYKIRFWLSNEENPDKIVNRLASRIWYRLKREDISIPFPIQDLYVHQEKDDHQKVIEHRLSLLANIDFFIGLTPEQKQYIAERLEECWYETGEDIVVEGAFSSDFYIIDRGRVGVFINKAGTREVAELGAADFFGEMSLLTGEKRSATVRAKVETRLLKLGRESMGHLLNENTRLAETLSAALAQRSKRNTDLIDGEQGDVSARRRAMSAFDSQGSKAAILSRIKSFFKLC